MNDASGGGPREPELIDADSLDFGLGVAFARDGRRPGEGVAAAIERMTGGGSRVLLRDDQDAPSPVLRMLPAGSAERIGDDGRYQVMGEIARGGLGVVLKGRDRDLGRDVALKVLRPEFAKNDAVLARFIEEAQIGGQLQHPGIVPVYSLGIESEGRPFFAMKLVKGRTLAALLVDRKSPRDGQRRLLGVFEQVCRTMAYAHSRRVVHRDLKPSNVMLGAFGEIQVVDWGLAKVLGREDVPSVRPAATDAPEISLIATVRSGSAGSGSLAGSVLGTPGYMSPEQAIGRVEDVDERTDVFALGSILCEILTGQPPFTGDARDQILLAARANLDDAGARLAKCGADAAIVAVALKCLAAERGERFADAGAVAAAVTEHLSGIEARARRAEVDAAVARAKADEERAAAARERTAAAAAKRAHRRTIALAAVALTGVAAGIVVWRREAVADSERVTKSIAAVSAALADANAKRGAKDVVGALASAQKAVALAKTGGADAESVERAAQLLADVEADDRAAAAAAAESAKTAALFARLDAIDAGVEKDAAAGHATPGPAMGPAPGRAQAPARLGEQNWAPWNAENDAAFREFGVDVDAADAAPAVAAIRGSSRAIEIAAALDDWAGIGRLRAKDAGKTPAEFDARIARIEALADAADPEPARTRVRDAMHRGDKDALRALAVPSEVEKLPLRTRVMVGRELSSFGDSETALTILKQVVRRHPGDARAAANLVTVLLSDGSLSRVSDDIRTAAVAAIALRPTHWLWERLGYTLTNADETDLEVASFREARRLNAECAKTLVGLAIALKNAGSKAEAEETLDLMLALPNQPLGYQALAVRAEWIENSGDLPRAAEAYRRQLAAKPDAYFTSLGRSRLANVLRQLGDKAGAEALRLESAAAVRDAAHASPNDFNAVMSLGHLCYWDGDMKAAATAYRDAIGLDPKDSYAYDCLVYALANGDEAALAVAEARRAAELFPKDWGVLGVNQTALSAAWSHAADQAAERPRTLAAFDEVVALCRTAVASAPRDADLHDSLGRALGARADVLDESCDEAIAEFRTAVRLAPTDFRVRNNLIASLGASGYDAETVAEVRAWLQIGSPSASMLYLLTDALWSLDQIDDALAEARRAVALVPDNYECQYTLAALLSIRCARGQGGDWSEVLAASRRTCEILQKIPHPTAAQKEAAKDAASDVTVYEYVLDPKFVERTQPGKRPADPWEAARIVEVCLNRRMTVAGVRCAIDALAFEPKLVEKNAREVRDWGASLCVLAADGQGEGADALDAATRDALRRRGLEWTREVLAYEIGRMASPKRSERISARRTIPLWLTDPTLASVREPEALAKLSVDDRVAWQRFWAEVDRAVRDASKRAK